MRVSYYRFIFSGIYNNSVWSGNEFSTSNTCQNNYYVKRVFWQNKHHEMCKIKKNIAFTAVGLQYNARNRKFNDMKPKNMDKLENLLSALRMCSFEIIASLLQYPHSCTKLVEIRTCFIELNLSPFNRNCELQSGFLKKMILFVKSD